MIFHAKEGSHWSSNTVVAPSISGTVTPNIKPVIWAVGEPIKITSDSLNFVLSIYFLAAYSCVFGVCITPFGAPVVPDVYINKKTSLADKLFSSNAARCSAVTLSTRNGVREEWPMTQIDFRAGKDGVKFSSIWAWSNPLNLSGININLLAPKLSI